MPEQNQFWSDVYIICSDTNILLRTKLICKYKYIFNKTYKIIAYGALKIGCIYNVCMYKIQCYLNLPGHTVRPKPKLF